MDINVTGKDNEEWFGIPESVFAPQVEPLIEQYFSRDITTAEFIKAMADLGKTPQAQGYLMYCTGGIVMTAIVKRIVLKEDYHEFIKSKLPQN